MSRTLISMIEQMEPGVVILNSDLTVCSISSMIFLIFGNVPRERLFEGDLLGLHSEEARTKVSETLRLARQARRHIPLSLKIISTEGQDRYLVIKLLSLAGREPADDRICALFYDITPLISAERQLIRLPVTLQGEIHLLKPEEIVFLKADNIYALISTESREYHCDMSLGTIEKRLSSEMFFRIHRSYLVNIAKVRKVHRERHECSVETRAGEVRLPVSRDKLQSFLVEIGLK
jgi:DNA-binding LytR/AlgR family response regulator